MRKNWHHLSGNESEVSIKTDRIAGKVDCGDGVCEGLICVCV